MESDDGAETAPCSRGSENKLMMNLRERRSDSVVQPGCYLYDHFNSVHNEIFLHYSEQGVYSTQQSKCIDVFTLDQSVKQNQVKLWE